jgi:predicted Zn-dependent protease
MIHPQRLKEKLSSFIKTKEADKVSIVFFRTITQVSRFANSQIHQHISDEDQAIYFRILLDGRMGIASTNSIDEQNLKEAFKKALAIARIKLDTQGERDIPAFNPVKPLAGFYFPKTAHTDALARTRILKKIFDYGDDLKVKFSGNLYNGLNQIAVIGAKKGQMNYQDHSFAGIKLIAASKKSSGYASSAGYTIDSLNPHKVADAAIEKCILGFKRIALEPGRYDVILEPAAVAELIGWLNYIGFGAKHVFEETSFLYNKAGKRITGDSVSIYDYGLDKNTFILPFDFEGNRRKKTYLIKKGVAQAPLCDSYYAKLLKMGSTGHANFPDETDGPLGYNLIMEGGKEPANKIISSAKKAILITRFHYINGFLDTQRALMTGMTRDGTFLIEDGKVKSAVKDMRFTESILEAFSRITRISKERKLIADHLESLGSVCAPTLYIKDFNFTS